MLQNEIFKLSEGVNVVDVTPELAKKLLEESNLNNRKVRPLAVKRYSRSMSMGDWKFSPEAISISKTGRLLNGQHRMLAVVDSGVTTRFLFATGFDDDVFEVIDRGVARTRVDALRLNRKLVQDATLLCNLNLKTQSLATDSEVARVANTIAHCHGDLMGFCGTNVKLFSSAPFRLAAVARVMGGEDREYVFDLYRNLVLANTHKLPLVGQTAVKMFMTNKLRSGGGGLQRATVCFAWVMFSQKNKDRARLKFAYDADLAKEIVEATGCEKA
jgi:hypothetical protein